VGGSLGRIGHDPGLLAQGEVGEARQAGRGGSSAMPNKRNPVATLIGIAAAARTPHPHAALLAESIGKARGHDLLARLAAESAAEGPQLVRREVGVDAALAVLDRARIATAFDVDAAAQRAGALAVAQLDALQRNEEGTLI
jgi:3-carboxy-cis,cis-muconate cycloisomerase